MRVVETHLETYYSEDDYKRILTDLLGRLDHVVGREAAQVAQLLTEAQAEIRSTIAALPDGSRSKETYEKALAGIEHTMDEYARAHAASLKDAVGDGYDIGALMGWQPLDHALPTLNLSGIAKNIPPYQATILGTPLPGLVQGVEVEGLKRIRYEIGSVMMGAKTPIEAAQAIGSGLTDPNHFRTLNARARAITVTEIGRAQALGQQYAQQTLADSFALDPDIDITVQKRWINAHLPGARLTHLAAEQDYAPGGTPGPIPHDESYVINGTPAMYPRDPSLPASESVNCHCVSITHIPEIMDEAGDGIAGDEEIQKAQQPAVAKDTGEIGKPLDPTEYGSEGAWADLQERLTGKGHSLTPHTGEVRWDLIDDEILLTQGVRNPAVPIDKRREILRVLGQKDPARYIIPGQGKYAWELDDLIGSGRVEWDQLSPPELDWIIGTEDPGWRSQAMRARAQMWRDGRITELEKVGRLFRKIEDPSYYLARPMYLPAEDLDMDLLTDLLATAKTTDENPYTRLYRHFKSPGSPTFLRTVEVAQEILDRIGIEDLGNAGDPLRALRAISDGTLGEIRTMLNGPERFLSQVVESARILGIDDPSALSAFSEVGFYQERYADFILAYAQEDLSEYAWKDVQAWVRDLFPADLEPMLDGQYAKQARVALDFKRLGVNYDWINARMLPPVSITTEREILSSTRAPGIADLDDEFLEKLEEARDRYLLQIAEEIDQYPTGQDPMEWLKDIGPRRDAKDLIAQGIGRRLEETLGSERVRQFAQFLHDEGFLASEAKGVFSYDSAASLVAQWASTSGDSNPLSIAIQRAAAEEFGLSWVFDEVMQARRGGIGFRTALAKAGRIYDDYSDVLRAFQRAQYEATQTMLDRMGYGPDDLIPMLRGVDAPGMPAGESVSITTNPLSSFSLEYDVAQRFAGTPGDSYRMVIQWVPRDRIVGMPLSGVGCLHEYEFVVMEGIGDTALVAADPYALPGVLTRKHDAVPWDKWSIDEIEDLFGKQLYAEDLEPNIGQAPTAEIWNSDMPFYDKIDLIAQAKGYEDAEDLAKAYGYDAIGDVPWEEVETHG